MLRTRHVNNRIERGDGIESLRGQYTTAAASSWNAQRTWPTGLPTIYDDLPRPLDQFIASVGTAELLDHGPDEIPTRFSGKLR